MLSEYLSPAHTRFTLEIIRSWYESPCPSCLNSVNHEELNVPQAPKVMWACSEAAVGHVVAPRPSPLPPPSRIQTEPAEAGPTPVLPNQTFRILCCTNGIKARGGETLEIQRWGLGKN